MKFLNVPLIAQTSNNTCWHASSMMIWNYWKGVTNKQGPMNTLADNYKNDQAVTVPQFVTLAGKVGLKKVFPKQSVYTSNVLETLLSRYGPLWCVGFWFGVGHIIVLKEMMEKEFLSIGLVVALRKNCFVVRH
jgi:ABC-type bacteriocin/lantibiotic exporter with double-glycine peptidase domain